MMVMNFLCVAISDLEFSAVIARYHLCENLVFQTPSFISSQDNFSLNFYSVCQNIILFLYVYSRSSDNYTVSRKKTLYHHTFVHNFDKCSPIFRCVSPSYSPRNLQQNSRPIFHHPLKMLLHYLAKHKRPKSAKFCCMQHNDSCLMLTKFNKLTVLFLFLFRFNLLSSAILFLLIILVPMPFCLASVKLID